MDMFEDYEALERRLSSAFDRFEVLQARLLEEVKESPGQLAESLPRWGLHRKQAFEDLRKGLDDLNSGLETGMLEPHMAPMWRERLHLLLEKEAELYETLALLKGEILDTLSRLQKGKRALEGYSSARKGPVFLRQDA